MFNSAPFINQTAQDKRVTAFGDTVLAFALSPSPKLVGNWLLAAGPSFIFPTATNSLIGQNNWQVGPAAAVGYQGKDFITYVFPQQWFSVGGDGRKPAICCCTTPLSTCTQMDGAWGQIPAWLWIGKQRAATS
ncbi:MAG: hypothetical protein JO159_00840 [Acidobacteria bacterium]|nr:hypothetical protein [Acidobacteriota bacterium]